MTHKKLTVHTELLDGNLDGARDIYMGANSTCHLYVVPRDNISMVSTLKDVAGQPAFYILLGDESLGKQKAYIGQTTDFLNRKNDHMQKKDWWNKALIFVSDNHKIYGDDVKYLEFLGIQTADATGTVELQNSTKPKCPAIPSYRINDMNVFFRDIEFLTAFYGCKIFIKPKESDQSMGPIFYLTNSRGADAMGWYNKDTQRFIILKGSKLALSPTNSYKGEALRQKWIGENCEVKNGAIELLHDVEIDSPSTAAQYVSAASSNGWTLWKDKDGKTLDQIYRKGSNPNI